MRAVRCGLWVALVSVVVGGFTPSWGQGERPQLYVFSMQNCDPCRQMEPAVDRLLREGFPVQKIDCQAQPQWANHFQITQTPTVVLVRSGQSVARHVGALNYAELVGLFHAAGFSPATGGAPPPGASHPPSQAAAAPSETNLAAVSPRRELPPRELATAAPAGSAFATPNSEQRAYQATVRLKVEDPTGISYGTGTVIHHYQNAYLVITCGHIFRESQGKGTVSVDHGFASGSPRTARGELLGYDAAARDVALVVFESPLEIQPAPLAPPVIPIQPQDEVFSVGCNHGADPTTVTCQVIRSAVYDGARKYDTTVRPVDGRSGGGLFSAGGQLIGICNAAAVEQDEGIYSALENIFWQLQQSNLAHLFPASGSVGATGVAASQTPPAPLSAGGTAPSPTAIPSQAAMAESNSPPSSLATATRPQGGAGSNADVELIVIVRPKGAPDQARTFTVLNPSPDNLARLESQAIHQGELRMADKRSASSGNLVEGPPPRVIRGQSSR